MSKPMSKHRTGGPHSGQTQSSQRQQPIPDFQRSYPHIRQNNQQGAHLATNQINMHPQHQPQPQPNLQQGAPVLNSRMFPNNSNSQQIMSPPTMPVGHQNAPQPPSIIPNVANANRNNPAQYQNMNMNRMSFGNRFNLPRNYQQVPNMPPTQFVYQVPPYPNSAYPTPYNSSVFMVDGSVYQRPYYHPIPSMSIPASNIMSQNEYNPPSLPAEKQISLQKRAKKPALVYDTDGKLLDLQSIAKSDDKSSSTSVTNSKSPTDSNSDAPPIKVEAKEDSESSIVEQDIAEKNEQQQPNQEEISETNQSSQTAAPQEKSLNSCDSKATLTSDDSCEVATDAATVAVVSSTTDDSPLNGEAKCDHIDGDVSALTDKIEAVKLEDDTNVVESSKLCDQAVSIKTVQDLPPSHDNSNSIGETLNSGDMEQEARESPVQANAQVPSSSVVVKEEETEEVVAIAPKAPAVAEVPKPQMDEATKDAPAVASASDDAAASETASPTTAAPVVVAAVAEAPAVEKEEEDDEENVSESDLNQPNQQDDDASNLNSPKVYDRDFLFSRRKFASKNVLTNSKQDNIEDIMKKGNSDSFMPNFAPKMKSQNDSYRNKSQTQSVRRTSHPQRNYSDSKSRKIASNSLHKEYLLQHSENAWQPGKTLATDPDEIETEELLKSVRAILNKLTPQNYNNLLEKFKRLNINTIARLNKVIDLIFEKSIKEPAFVVQYAGFCSELVHIQVNEVVNGQKTENNFKNLLVNKCQNTFFKKMYSDIEDLEEREKQIEECTNMTKKRELFEILDDEKSLSRKRSVGNVKLIAELYKLTMLTPKIIFSCFKYLLEQEHEDYIEYLCTLITNIGYTLSLSIQGSRLEQFNSVFKSLDEIYNQETDLEVSARVRFMILDLLDLRKNNWISSKTMNGPKTIAQFHEDSNRQQQQLKEMNAKKKNASSNNDEWQQVKRKSNQSSSQKIDTKVANIIKNISNKPMGGSNTQSTLFTRGSHGGSNSNSQSRSSSSTFENKYNVLSNERNQRPNSTYHDSLSTKDTSKWRNDERKTSDITNYYNQANNSRNNSRNSSVARNEFPNMNKKISCDDLEGRTSKCLTNYLSDEDYESTIVDLTSFCDMEHFKEFIYFSMTSVFDKSSQKSRLHPFVLWGGFLGKLFSQPLYDIVEIFEGFKLLFQSEHDLTVDFPKFWDYLSEVIAHVLISLTNDYQRKRDVFKSITDSFSEIVGNPFTKFKTELEVALKKINTECAQEILSSLRDSVFKSKDIGYLSIDKLIEEHFIKLSPCGDPRGFVSELKKNFSEDMKDNKFRSALYYKLAKSVLSDKKEEFNRNPFNEHIDHMLEILKELCPSAEEKFLLLESFSVLAHELHYPTNFLFNCFLKLNEVLEESVFIDWNSKSSNNISKANVQRFIAKLTNQPGRN